VAEISAKMSRSNRVWLVYAYTMAPAIISWSSLQREENNIGSLKLIALTYLRQNSRVKYRMRATSKVQTYNFKILPKILKSQ
jgi:hypothetical protein